MTKLLTFLVVTLALAAGFVWIAENPGTVAFDWMGYRIETSLMIAAIAFVILVVVIMMIWAVIRWVVHGPAAVGDFFRTRRKSRGFKALSSGMIAANAGDVHGARSLAKQADKLLEGEPLVLLLKAQAAQLAGDRKAAHEAFEAMTKDAQTESIGLRGLYLEAHNAGDEETAFAHAEQAAARAPGLPWAANAMLDHQTRVGNWDKTLELVERNADNKLIDRAEAKRLKAVLLTAQAQEKAETSPEEAFNLARDAHRLAPDLVPAAVIAGQHLASTGQTSKAIRILEKTWKLSPHPDLADVYAHARTGDSARDRLKRVRILAKAAPGHEESRIAVAQAALDAREFAAAREELAPLVADRPSQRVCLLMADIAEAERGDKGEARAWLSRAVRAPRDPAWTADGHVLQEWAPASPVTGKLDAFEWRVPVTVLGAAMEGDIDAAAFDDGEVPDVDDSVPVIESRPTVATAPDDITDAEAADIADIDTVPDTPEDEGAHEEPATEDSDETRADGAITPDEPEDEDVFIPPPPDVPKAEPGGDSQKRKRSSLF